MRNEHGQTALGIALITKNVPVAIALLDAGAIATAALPDGTPAALFGLYEVLSSVGIVWPQMTGAAAGTARFDVRIVGLTEASFDCAMGMPWGYWA